MNKELQVKALENGTVIDHIPSDKLFKVVSLLKLDGLKDQITIGNNLSSKQMGLKGIIKVADRYYAEQEVNRIALVAPMAKINTIRNFEVVEKRILTLPESFIGLVKCPNPKCITNNEPMKTRFETVSKEPVVLKCQYCEREVQEDGIQLI
jgi:aspartate carbamoyltransferase regulatory subunit